MSSSKKEARVVRSMTDREANLLAPFISNLEQATARAQQAQAVVKMAERDLLNALQLAEPADGLTFDLPRRVWLEVVTPNPGGTDGV